jgi:hypothetical protein
MPKHQKSRKPTDKNLDCNPMIGGSKGAYRAGARPKELEDSQGETRSRATSQMTRHRREV